MTGSERRGIYDPVAWVTVVVAFVLRAVPLWGGVGGCARDECTYRILGRGIVEGQGLVAPEGGWLWAPGYPYLVAASQAWFGSEMALRWFQVGAGMFTVAMLYRLGGRLGGLRAARVAALAYAVHPTFAYYAGSLWSEVVYAALLVSAVEALLWSRAGGWGRALVPGMLVGACMLFRGVATYMAPIFALAAVWPVAETVGAAWRARGKHAVFVLIGMALVAGPYAVHASQRHGGVILSDATLGQMMWLGNNDFEPISFDVGNGLLETKAYDAVAATGRKHCARTLPPARWDRCEVRRGVEWIQSHPRQFVQRIPLRLAQLAHPHTFLTRHLRWGKWNVPYAFKEGLVVYVAASSFVVVLGGLAAAALLAEGPFGVLSVGIVAYHVAAIAMLAGLSRYRLPLEPFGLVYLAMFAARPRAVLAAHPSRWVAAAVLVAGALPLMLWFLPDGFPGRW